MGYDKLFNLERHVKRNRRWVHDATVVFSMPYAVCKGQKRKHEANKAHYEVFKIVEV